MHGCVCVHARACECVLHACVHMHACWGVCLYMCAWVCAWVDVCVCVHYVHVYGCVLVFPLFYFGLTTLGR